MSIHHYTTLISAANLAALIASGSETVTIFDCRFDLVDENTGKLA